jgi:glutathione S-transferase
MRIEALGGPAGHDAWMPSKRATLFGVPGSHPTLSVELMLRYKGIPYTRHDLPNMTHRAVLPLLRFRGSTVPVMKLDGRRVTSTRRIVRALEAAEPLPPLLPVDAELETWADDTLQECVRTLGRWAAVHDRVGMTSFLDGAKMGVPTAWVKASMPVAGPLTAMQMKVSDDATRAQLAVLPRHLDRVDALLADGVIGGEQRNALDFEIAPSVRLAMLFEQLRPKIAERPAGGHAMRVCPDYPGAFGPVFPKEWLPF